MEKILKLLISLSLIKKLIFILCPPLLYAKINQVKMGVNCKISSKNWGSEPFLIEIGNHVHITRGVRFITHDGGVWVFRDKNPNFDVFGKIFIGNNTFIGNDSTILYGVHIGNNCVIGANSVVTKSIPDGTVVAGNPAKMICTTQDYYYKMNSFNTNFRLNKNKKKLLMNMDNDQFIIRKRIV